MKCINLWLWISFRMVKNNVALTRLHYKTWTDKTFMTKHSRQNVHLFKLCFLFKNVLNMSIIQGTTIKSCFKEYYLFVNIEFYLWLGLKKIQNIKLTKLIKQEPISLWIFLALKRAVCWCYWFYLSRCSKWPPSARMHACSLLRNASTARSIAACGKSFQIASSSLEFSLVGWLWSEHFVPLKHSAPDVVVTLNTYSNRINSIKKGPFPGKKNS